MYYLIYFLKSKTKAVITADLLSEEKQELEETVVQYGKKKYAARILKKSNELEYLESLEVGKDGRILTNIETKLIEEKENTKLKKKNRIKAMSTLNNNIQNEKTIFECKPGTSSTQSIGEAYVDKGLGYVQQKPEKIMGRNKVKPKKGIYEGPNVNVDNEKDDGNLDDNIQILKRSREKQSMNDVDKEVNSEISNKNKKIRKIICTDEDKISNNVNKDIEPKNSKKKLHKKIPDTEEWEKLEKTILEVEEDEEEFNTSQHTDTGNNESANESEAMYENEDEEKDCSNCKKLKLAIDKSINTLVSVSMELQKLCEENEKMEENLYNLALPAYQKRKGALEIKSETGIYIDGLSLADAKRFKNRPTEMTRRLMLYLVGKENLKKLVPKGNKNRAGVPQDIQNVIFWYVNKHTDRPINYEKFMATISNQCTTLRNPKANLKPIVKKSKREATQRDVVERERRQRMEAEAREREATAEAERAWSKVHLLQRELARMEETARGLLQQKQRTEQLNQEKSALILSYEEQIQQYQSQISKLQVENESMRGQLRGLEVVCTGEVHAALVARLATLESEHVSLVRDADAQRRQCERCLDDVANQVVRALLFQKGLREEIGALQRRIRELEARNKVLSGILKPTVTSSTPSDRIQGILEAGPAALVAALELDSSWISLSRPNSLNLQIPMMATAKCRRSRPLDQKPVEEEGSESPESGNRDEGYSTMSSDVQGEGVRQEAPRGLEDLKEASDETEADVSPDARLVSLDPSGDPDILFLPVNLTVGLNPRHSYPPRKDLLPYQHVMRSFSDSHLCLKFTATSNITPYLPSPSGSSSLFLVEEDAWDAEYVQQWLRLDETRSAQQHRDILKLEYDRAELEDWSFSLSSEDIAASEGNGMTSWKEPTVSQALPAIKEHNQLELEEDASECLWNGASYLADRTGGELVALLMDNRYGGPWPYASSTRASWSSEDVLIDNGSSKRSSAAFSGCSDDPDSPSVGTDFTRDFYRLVKFESTKSLASTSSRTGRPLPDRDQALQSVLSFIAEQQMYLSEIPSSIIANNSGRPLSTEISEVSGSKRGSEVFSTDTDEILEEPKTGYLEKSSEELLDEIPVPPLAPEERIISAIGCIEGISYTTLAPSELGAVPEEDEEAATSSTPSTVVSPARATVFIEGRDRSLSFHDRATSKDVIDELNRMIRSGDDNPARQDSHVALEKLDLACCCPTGWVHVERDIDFTDPKARANLLDVMLASSESSSATSSSGSAGSDSGDEPTDYRHLHRLHRYRRQKKASAAQAHRVLRLPPKWGSTRPSIIGRGGEFFVRYGEKEREAVASFDFLNDISVSTSLLNLVDSATAPPIECESTSH